MMLRIVAELSGSTCMRTTVRDETGSPVSMYSRTTSASTCRWRFCCNAGTAVMSLESSSLTNCGMEVKHHAACIFSVTITRGSVNLRGSRLQSLHNLRETVDSSRTNRQE